MFGAGINSPSLSVLAGILNIGHLMRAQRFHSFSLMDLFLDLAGETRLAPSEEHSVVASAIDYMRR